MMLQAANRGQIYAHECGRTWSADVAFGLLHLSGMPIYTGFELRRPWQPSNRRKNGAAKGVSFDPAAGAASEPTAEEIEKVRSYFASKLDEGIDCPCCTRFAQRQHRSFGCGPARWLIELVYLADDPDKFIHTGRVIKNLEGEKISGSDATSVLPLYGMIEEGDGETPLSHRRPGAHGEPKGRTSGFWRPTRIGRAFIFDKIRVPAKIVTCIGVPESFEGPPVGIRDTLEKKFNYDEIMGRFAPVSPSA